jgi:Tol biopolymer transport system component
MVRGLVTIGVGLLAVTLSVAQSAEPSGSRDGRLLAFTVPGEAGGISVVRADGTGQRSLTKHGWLPSWSPDGNWIAFITDRDSWKAGECETTHRGDIVCPYDLYVVSADGREQRLLTTHRRKWSHSVGGSPSWSPDGRSIAVVAGPGEDARVEIVHLDGRPPRLLTDNRDWNEFDPAWSPNGRSIAFSGQRRSHWSDIAVVDVATRRQRLLTRNRRDDASEQDGAPAWSPDGKTIVFWRNQPSVYGGTWLVGAEGGLARLRAVRARSATWSPDGRRIVVLRDTKSAICGPGEDVRSVVVLNVKPQSQRLLYRSCRNLGGPVWSGDGRLVAFQQDLERGLYYSRDGNASYDIGLWVVTTIGGKAVRIARHAAQPAWRP